MLPRTRTKLFFLVAALLLVFLILLGIATGSTSLDLAVVVRVLVGKVIPVIDTGGIAAGDAAIVWAVRVPRVLVAAIVGASLAIAGAQMQGLFKNPLASPDITGTSSGAALGAVIALASGLAARSLFYLPLFAFAGALASLFAVYLIATRRGRTPVATLLLAGVATGALISAATSFVITLSWVSYDVAGEIVFWLLGGLDSRTWIHVWLALPPFVIGGALALFYTRELDLLTGGEDAALALGVEVETVKRVMLVGAALLTGASVAVGGIVGFVGLIVPHVVRLTIGPAHGKLIPASALAGAVFLVAADLLARVLLRPQEIRLGIITAAVGAPFFLYLLLRERDRASEIG